MIQETMDYLFLIITSCLISFTQPISDKVSAHAGANVNAELFYSDQTLFLRIENNTGDSLYLFTKAFDEIRLFFDGKRMTDAEFFYNPEDLPPVPDPPLYDSLELSAQKKRVGTFINYIDKELADSTLISYFIDEYMRMNNRDSLNAEEVSFLLSDMNIAMFLTGAVLFLPPHGSYTFDFNYSCFKRNSGKYKITCRSVSVHPRLKYYESYGMHENEIIKLPYIPPGKLLGYKRYDKSIKCKSLRFSIKDSQVSN